MEVVPAVEDVADVGKTDVDEDAGVEDSTAADIGNWLQFRCFGQGRLMWWKWWM